jgi:PAS domain S-box-containing protein
MSMCGTSVHAGEIDTPRQIMTKVKKTKRDQPANRGDRADKAGDKNASGGDWLRLCIEEAPFGIMVHDKSGQILSFNARLEKISGYSKKEIADIRTWIEKVYPDKDYRTIILEERQTASTEPESKTRTKPAIITRKDGVKLPCRFSSAWTSAGTRIVFIEEADDRESEADLLRESENRFHLLSETAFEAVILHKQGVLLKANAQFYKMFGYDSQELLGTRIVPQVFAANTGDFAKPKTGKKAAPPYETVGYKKDGTQIPVLINTRPIRYHGREVKLSAIQDLTDNRQTQLALRNSEARLKTIIESLPYEFFMLDADERYLMVNSVAQGRWGNPVGKRPEDLAVDKKTLALWKKNNRRALAGETVAEEVELGRQGKRRYFYNIISPIHSAGQIIGIVGVNFDLTELKEAEKRMEEKDKKLKRQKKNLEEMNTALRVLLEQREKEKADFKENIFMNLNKLVLPYIEKLRTRNLEGESQIYLEIIRSNLNDLIGPLANTLSSKFFGFTPSEIQIANLIGQGKTTKEIATMLYVSPKAISFHRSNIRKKLGLLNKKANLRTYLQSFPAPSQ